MCFTTYTHTYLVKENFSDLKLVCLSSTNSRFLHNASLNPNTMSLNSCIVLDDGLSATGQFPFKSKLLLKLRITHNSHKHKYQVYSKEDIP